MARKLFTIHYDDTVQHVLATTYAQAITWAEGHVPRIADSQVLTIAINKDLVDLTAGASRPAAEPAADRSSARPANTPPRATKAPKAAKRATAKPAVELAEDGLPKGSILLADLALEYDLTREGIKYKLKRAGVDMERIAGHGRPLAANERAARAALDGRPLEQVSKAPAAKGPATKPASGRMLLVEKAAIELGLTDAQVREIQRNGNIKGGNGWVDIDGLRAYMESDDYEAPFTSN
ncbi:MAG TPA: hypothetical protein PKE21_13680 [Flavobacteriales bacterium]|nr:hypothetical protein [Flavobacteriales bacterium]HMR28527.1 hypothetical protein [Flavobacteriales bacterium]